MGISPKDFDELLTSIRNNERWKREGEEREERSGHVTQLQIAMQSAQLSAARSVTDAERVWFQKQADALEWVIRFVYQHEGSR